ncbi:ABC transporter substrate-binding protein/permease [Clostridiaceae bacterium UIB06]|uniref:ABC transporter substrate-binding protein/permease n=1 Tax=Clostridium thailandense TaxID=2794346 RepID=A0A949WUC3_9CLOT|nr:ABC transporter substrate-binding protein/permease [Clostridium thailandense]MBV7272437.1 ABC transporter substrate-binding protein/permease [Clostridium thailandense]MCH5136961.1 ABC transporter substrate-binding protein/permease [Clostridiaceae bacterium UIB06]
MKKILTGIICILLCFTFFIEYRVNVYGSQGSNKKGDLQKFTTVEDIKNKRIGVLLGSLQAEYALKNYPNATVLQYKSSSDALVALKSKKVDAILNVRETMMEILKADKSMGFLGGNLYEVPVGVGFNKNNTKLSEEFNSFLKKIKSNGVYDDMVKRWMIDGSQSMPQIPNKEDNGTLVVGGVSDDGLPFTTVKDGKLVGFDVEIETRFAAELGKKLVFSDMEFGSLIAAVSTNKVDMITSALAITEERKKKINFSDPYYKLGTGVLVLKENLASYASETNHDKTESSFIKSIGDSFYNNIILENRYMLIVNGLKLTIIVAGLAAVFGTILGMLICFMRMSRNRLLINVASGYIAILRGTPILVFLMLIFYVFFASVNIDPVFAAIIAFGMNFAAYVSEMFRTAILGIDKGQQEAGIATGFTKVQTFLYIIMPQAIKQVLPVYKGEVISLLKNTSIVGYIAVQDLTKAGDIIRSRTFDAFFPLIMVATIYFILSWLLTMLLDYMGRKIDPRARKQSKSKIKFTVKESNFTT